MEKMCPDGPKWGKDDFFLANPDLADILGDKDFDFENFHFLDFVDPKFPDFQVLGPGLGPKRLETISNSFGRAGGWRVGGRTGGC